MVVPGPDDPLNQFDLQFVDFPKYYPDSPHPRDYEPVDAPFVEYIPPDPQGCRYRLVFRACWKVAEGRFIPMSFICNTGAPAGLWLSKRAVQLLKEARRTEDDAAGVRPSMLTVDINAIGRALVQQTPGERSNIVGLKMLHKLGLKLKGDMTFSLEDMPDYF